MMSCCSNHSKDCGLWIGLVAFILGAVVLLQRFGAVPDEVLSYLWPSLLIVIGLKFMIGSCESCGSGSCCESGTCDTETPVVKKMPMKKKRK
jgi:uncharacterized membrane protein YfcA